MNDHLKAETVIIPWGFTVKKEFIISNLKVQVLALVVTRKL
jgi:hypothetical protein